MSALNLPTPAPADRVFFSDPNSLLLGQKATPTSGDVGTLYVYRWAGVRSRSDCPSVHELEAQGYTAEHRSDQYPDSFLMRKEIPMEPNESEAEEAIAPLAPEEEWSLFGRDLFGEKIDVVKDGVLSRRFEFPPFSVLDARSGDWQDRKRAWVSCGIKGEIGRAENLTIQGQAASFDYYRVKEGTRTTTDTQGTSIFDPVLTELCYRWFCRPGGTIVDPFAGGSVRGIVAGLLGFEYHGIELREEQVCANVEQKRVICYDKPVRWICGDSIEQLAYAPEADFVFSCPPYGNLERYSENPLDLSTMDDYPTFLAAYKRIILRCTERLLPGRLAAFVVGDFRDKKTGNYRGFVADTVNAFRECGMSLYNDAVVVTPCGSLPIRVSGQFEKGRKLGKTHQNLLVFVKGEFWGMR